MATKSPEYKVIIVGDSSVGKSSIVNRYHRNSFCSEYQSTVGASFVTRTIQTQSGKVNINIWDTAGQEKYRSLVPMYSRNASSAIIVFDLSLPNGFESVKDWYSSVKTSVPEECKIVVACNKSDLPIAIETDKAFAWVNENKLQMTFVSAKTGDGIEQLFQAVVEMIPRTREKSVIEMVPETKENQKACC